MNVDNMQCQWKKKSCIKTELLLRKLRVNVRFTAQSPQSRTPLAASTTWPGPKYITWTIIKSLTQAEELWDLEMETDLALHSQDNSA